MIFEASKLLLTPVETGGAAAPRVRYVALKGRTVQAEGDCAAADLPGGGALRVAFLSRSGYFDRVEAEVKSAKMLPFQARRLVDAALAFNEPFRVRYAAHALGADRQRLDLVAVADADYAALARLLPLQSRACDRVALVESAIAALVAQETPEPAAVLWLRGANLLGLLVENGAVLARLLDRAAGAEAAAEGLAGRLERMRGSLRSATRRVFPEREISLHLALGELADLPQAQTEIDSAAATALQTRLARRYTGGQPNAALRWPEVYGLQTLSNDFSLLDPGLQQRAWAEKSALGVAALLMVGAAATAAAAALRHADGQRLAAEYENRRSAVAAKHAALEPRMPEPAELAALAQRAAIEAGVSDFRIDSLLAWISQITPRGAIIRELQANPAPTSPGGSPGAPAAAAAAVPLLISVEWELHGDYPASERLAAALVERLGERTQLSGSALTYTPGAAGGSVAHLTTTLTPLPGAFRQ